MRKIFCVFLCAVLSSAAALGQAGTSVTLHNQESSWFYFILDPAELSGLTTSSPLLDTKVAGFFARATEEFPFTALKPMTGLTLEGLPEGSHLIVGFFAVEDASRFPVRVFPVLVDDMLGQRFYGVYSEPALIDVPRGVGRLTRFPKAQSAAKTALAPAAQAPATPPAAVPEATTSGGQGLPEIAGFPPSFNPVAFSREFEGSFSLHPIMESKFWDRKGTRISSLSGDRADTRLTLAISSPSGFSADVSYFFYIFSTRVLGQDNSYTVELKPVTAEGKGIALLWEKGQSLPAPIGNVEVKDSECRVTAGLSDLPDGVVAGLGANASADLTSCYFDSGSGTYEEFYYTTLTLAQFLTATR